MDKELRKINIEFRACKDESNKRIVEGRAIPFGVKSPNREGFREQIMPEAVEGVLEKSDIKFLYNHDNSKGFLARYNKGKGKLNIEVKDDGVYFTFPLKNDNLSNYIWERIEDGELDEMSWAFSVAEDRWVKCDDGVYDRYIDKFDMLYDFSVVDASYYGVKNAVGCKRFAEIQEEERLENEKRMAEEEAKAQKEKEDALNAYYEKIKEENNKYLN